MSVVQFVVAIYDAHEKAEHAIKELQEAGVDMKSLPIVAKDTHTDEFIGIQHRRSHEALGKIGGLGGFWGWLFGSAFFAIPGIGPILERPGPGSSAPEAGGGGRERNRSWAHEYRYSLR